MSAGLSPTPKHPPQPTALPAADRLRRFLQAYWLRPENAVWMTLRSLVLSDCRWTHPLVDVSCGDGVFSFLHCGGAFDPAFDVFQSVIELDRVRDEHADMFDYVSPDYQPRIVSAATDSFDVGTDRKRSMLIKASRLSFYGRVVGHDNNNRFPFEDGSFETVYCNAAYWVENIDGFLRELGRITAPGGSIILQVKLDSCRRFSLAMHRERLGDRFLDLMGRGRLETWPTLADRGTWESRFRKASLGVTNLTPIATRTHCHIWEIGLRPIAPLLVRMVHSLTTDVRTNIKRDWLDLFCDLLAPFCRPDFDLFSTDDEPAEVQYVLTPR